MPLLDPNHQSRVAMMKRARLGNAIDEARAATSAALEKTAGDLADDLLKQHTLVSPDQASELEAHFNLEYVKEN